MSAPIKPPTTVQKYQQREAWLNVHDHLIRPHKYYPVDQEQRNQALSKLNWHIKTPLENKPA